MAALTAQRMENTPIPRLVISSSVPLMVSTLVSSLYNMVDSIYVSRISEKALSATTIAFPLTMLLFAASIGTAMGVNSRLSRFLGEGRLQDARETGWTGILLALLSCLPFMAVGAFGLPYLFPLLTTDAEILQMGLQYSGVVLLFCIGQMYASMGARLLQSTGFASLSMAAQVTGSVINCVLDPIMIYGWFGCPAMGIRGAAAATVLAQCVSGGMSTALYFVKNPSLRLGRKDLRFRTDLVRQIYQVALPMMLTMSLNSLLMMITNRILQDFSTTAIAFYGAYSKLQNFMFMPANGLSQGIVPLIGYFYGAKRVPKIRETTSFTVKLGSGVMVVGMAVFFAMPELLMSLFAPSAAMLEMSRVGLRILPVSFIPQLLILVYSNTFVGMGNGRVNMRCSLLRGILPIPLLLFLIRVAGTTWCWFAFVLADCTAALYAVYRYRVQMGREN